MAGSHSEQPQAGDTPRDGLSDSQSETGPLVNKTRPAESSPTPAEPPSDHAAPENEHPCPTDDADDQVPLDSEGTEPHETSTGAPPADDDGQHSPPKTGNFRESGNPDGSSGSNASAGKSPNTNRTGRRGRQSGNPGSERRESPSFRPGLICRLSSRIRDMGGLPVRGRAVAGGGGASRRHSSGSHRPTLPSPFAQRLPERFLPGRTGTRRSAVRGRALDLQAA